MIGPAAGVLLATQWSPGGTVLALGASVAVAAVGLMIFDPPTRSPVGSVREEPVEDAREPGSGAGSPAAGVPERAGTAVTEGVRGSRVRLLDPRMIAALTVAGVAVVVLAGTDVSVVAHTRAHHEVDLTWLVFVATAATISRLVPEERRGEAMGWYGSALTLGGSIGTPAAGFAIDQAGHGPGSPCWARWVRASRWSACS